MGGQLAGAWLSDKIVRKTDGEQHHQPPLALRCDLDQGVSEKAFVAGWVRPSGEWIFGLGINAAVAATVLASMLSTVNATFGGRERGGSGAASTPASQHRPAAGQQRHRYVVVAVGRVSGLAGVGRVVGLI